MELHQVRKGDFGMTMDELVSETGATITLVSLKADNHTCGPSEECSPDGGGNDCYPNSYCNPDEDKAQSVP
jgi:hypothetical protein